MRINYGKVHAALIREGYDEDEAHELIDELKEYIRQGWPPTEALYQVLGWEFGKPPNS